MDQLVCHGQPLLTFTFALAIQLAIVLIQLNLLVGGSVAITELVLASAGALSQRITVTLSHRECRRATDSLGEPKPRKPQGSCISASLFKKATANNQFLT